MDSIGYHSREPIVKRAFRYASEAHSGQLRKWTGEPYVSHCCEVEKLTSQLIKLIKFEFTDFPDIEIIQCVALLHDVIEDCEIPIDTLFHIFGKEVALGVWYLTDAPHFVGNRAVRKEMTRNRLANAPLWVKMIKVCDLYHNGLSIEENDSKFFEVFSRERDMLLMVMGETCETLFNYLQKEEIT